MPTGYSLPFDTPLALQAKANNITTSNVRRTAYFMVKVFSADIDNMLCKREICLHPKGEVQGSS